MTTLSLPTRPYIVGQRFQIVQPKAYNPSRNADNQAVAMGEPFWACEIETTSLTRALAGEFKWLDARAGGEMATVYLYDADRAQPLNGSITGATITAISRANRTLTFAGLGAGRVIAAGDYVHWDDGPARRLHILGAATADGSGVATVRCEPPPPASATAALPVAATFNKASGEFQIHELNVRYALPARSATLRATSIIRKF